VLAPVSVLAVWTANQVSNTSRYVENMAPLISEPAVQRALTDKITVQISRQIDVEGVARQAAAQLSKQGLTRLSSLLSTFSGSIASGVNGFIHTIVAKIVASPVVANSLEDRQPGRAHPAGAGLVGPVERPDRLEREGGARPRPVHR
jgi:hypothetical protein